MPWTETFIHLFALIIMLAGLVGVVLPFLPAGIPLVWFGVFLSGIGTRFVRVDLPFVATIGILVLLTYVFEFIGGRWGLKEARVTPFAVLGGVVGGLAGSLYGIVPALTVGPLLGSVLGEMLTGRDSIFVLETDAFKIIGYVGSTLIKVTVGVMIIGLWASKIFS